MILKNKSNLNRPRCSKLHHMFVVFLLIALYLRLSFKSIKYECYSYSHVSPASHTKPFLFLVIQLQNLRRKMFNVNYSVVPHPLVNRYVLLPEPMWEQRGHPGAGGRGNYPGPAKSLDFKSLLYLSPFSKLFFPFKMDHLVSLLSLRLSTTLSVDVTQPRLIECPLTFCKHFLHL